MFPTPEPTFSPTASMLPDSLNSSVDISKTQTYQIAIYSFISIFKILLTFAITMIIFYILRVLGPKGTFEVTLINPLNSTDKELSYSKCK